VKRPLKREPKGTPIKTYVVAHDPYMGGALAMEQLTGTWRQVLDHIDKLAYGIQEDSRTRLTDKELAKRLTATNGDGCDFVAVWCVDDQRQVFGGDR
jgi:hypothetical protein